CARYEAGGTKIDYW
nr:immunoglobulin heavy chain junction region [Macaca mulatta]MOX94873.1 immunoglobulin heavy chain junction region [Macaca mulatta]